MRRLWMGVLLLSHLLAMTTAGAEETSGSSAETQTVVICQVELNPPGDDRGREQVELFNPGDREADIGGWSISAVQSETTQTFQPGTIVPAHGTLKVKFEKADGQALFDLEESVVLRDESGKIVDETPALNDTENDNAIWTRLSGDENSPIHSWRRASLYQQTDEHALDAPAEAEESLDSLARYLGGPAKNDEERTRGIYRWIAANVEYDVEGSTTGACGRRTPEEVLEERKGVCSEYSALFSRLCELSGLEAVVIRGCGKGYGYSVGSKIPKSSNHAWNAVKIDGKWRLVDSTWGAGHLDPEEGYVQRFEEFYFLTPPEDLVWTHLPEDPSWQLLDAPLSKEEFEGIVYAKPAFFKNDMRIESPIEGTIDANDGANVTLSAPQDVSVIAELLDEEGRKLPKRFTMVRRSLDEILVRAACAGPGNCTLRIYSRRGEIGDQKAYDWTLDYRIEAGPKAQVQTGFPAVWDAFWDMGLDTKSHPEGLIEAGSELNVTFSATEDVLLLARLLDDEGRELPEDRTLAQREDDEYVVRASFPKPGNYSLRIYAKRAGEPGGEYTSAIEYAVLAKAGIEDMTYPRTLGTFNEAGARLRRPLEGRLEAGFATEFELLIPGAEEAAVINGGRWTDLSKEGEIFRGEANLSRGEAQVAARFPGERSYHSLLEYDVL
jgi:transglutaminase-like putative cysteine protease